MIKLMNGLRTSDPLPCSRMICESLLASFIFHIGDRQHWSNPLHAVHWVLLLPRHRTLRQLALICTCFASSRFTAVHQ
jgi:hypothetical protein